MEGLPSWAGAKRVGIDIETCDPYLKKMGPSVRRGGFIAGVAFAIEDGPAHYLPFRHQGGDNLPEEAVLRYLLDQSIAFRGEVVGANLNYDMDYLFEAGITFPNVKGWRDTQIADPLINELHDRYTLEHIAQRWGVPGKDEALLNNACQNFGVPKAEMWRLPAKYVGAYGEQDARLPLTLLRRQERVIEDTGLWDIYNLESELQPVLLRMRRHGVRIDFKALDGVEAWCVKEEQSDLDSIKQATGVRIKLGDVMKKDGIVAALTAIGVTLGKTPTGQPQVDKDILDQINHPVAESILHARKVNKIRTTFAASIREHAIGDRIHCTFNQLRRAREDADRTSRRAPHPARSRPRARAARNAPPLPIRASRLRASR